jgi:starch synthase
LGVGITILRVAIFAPEATPFSKAGGLGDVAAALPKALRENGVDVLLTLPLYGQTDRRLLRNQIIDDLYVEWRGTWRRLGVWYSEITGAPTFFIDAPEFYSHPNIYGYPDDPERFAFFSHAALTLLKRLGNPPNIIHLNDWPCGFAAVELHNLRSSDPYYVNTGTLFSIHNLAYQGVFGLDQLPTLGFGSPSDIETFTNNGHASPLKAGLMVSDLLSTVSKRYAEEIQTPELGCGLDWLLRARNDHLVGITNGIDYDVWNPSTDPFIAAHYTPEDISGKRLCKLDLLKKFSLPEEPHRPIVASISRLVVQKGFDLIRTASDAILQTGIFFISLGSGSAEYEHFLSNLHKRAPNQVGIYSGYNEPLAHQIEAGADIFLMPSLYEPCGLNQMYSMRYGTVPIVRATGGLDDTVENFDPEHGTGTGFKFTPYSPTAMLEGLYHALYFYAIPEIWSEIQFNGMTKDLSWSAAARKYIKVYRALADL